MAPPNLLLGPPELYVPGALPEAASAPPRPNDPSVDALVSNFNKFPSGHLGLPPMGLTENNSATYLSSGNPCLDFFFHVVPDTPPESLKERLALAWAYDPLLTLKLICNLRGVRGIGKSDRKGFYTAALWLFKNHPRTLGCNVGELAKFGYFKDLPEILFRLLDGSNMRRRQKCKRGNRRKFLMRPTRFPTRGSRFQTRGSRFPTRGSRFPTRGMRFPTRGMRFPTSGTYAGGRRGRGGMFPGNQKKARMSKSSIPREDRVAAAMARSKQDQKKARSIRLEKKIAMAKKLIDRYSQDGDFRYLYDNISDHFAHCLKADIGFLKSGYTRKISLAAKWCPSIDSSYDRCTLLCESIARQIFPRDSYPEYEGVEEAHYAYRIRDRLRKEVLVPLRKALELPEVYIGANNWGLIPYNRVASVAMKLYKDQFRKHDSDRFYEYLSNVKSGKTTIAAGALLPHEIISSFLQVPHDDGEVAELQWKRMVNDLLKVGKLENCIAVCDVSGSMYGIPMEVSIALGILVSELSKDPWKGKVITFSANPTLHLIEGDDLASKVQFVQTMEWGGSTDFQKVFDRILKVAKKQKLRPDQMIKRVLVFSDMEFDQASANPWETDYMGIKRKFRKAGYKDEVPQIVFWNLRDSGSTPVCSDQDGVALVSGFSKNLLKLFLDDDGKMNPESVMLSAISGEEYQNLVLID